MTMVINAGATDTDLPCVLYENVFADGVITASSGDGLNAVSGTTWDFWTGVGASTLTVVGDITEVDCLFIDAHNLATVGSAITLAYWNGSSWVNIHTSTPMDNSAIMVLFADVTSTQFRIGASGASIGVVMLGKRLVFEYGIDQSHTAINHGRTIDVIGGDSLTGQFTGQQITKRSATSSPNFPLLTREWVDNDMAMFEDHYNNAIPFAWASHPNDFPDDMGYCQRSSGMSELRPSYYEGGKYCEMTMELAVYQNV